MLAEKCYAEEEQNSMEVYSLVTGIPVKDLAALETKLMILMDYRLVVQEGQFNLLLRGDIESLFEQRTTSS